MPRRIVIVEKFITEMPGTPLECCQHPGRLSVLQSDGSFGTGTGRLKLGLLIFPILFPVFHVYSGQFT